MEGKGKESTPAIRYGNEGQSFIPHARDQKRYTIWRHIHNFLEKPTGIFSHSPCLTRFEKSILKVGPNLTNCARWRIRTFIENGSTFFFYCKISNLSNLVHLLNRTKERERNKKRVSETLWHLSFSSLTIQDILAMEVFKSRTVKYPTVPYATFIFVVNFL